VDRVVRVLTDWFNGDGVKLPAAVVITSVLGWACWDELSLFDDPAKTANPAARSANRPENLPTAEQIRLARQLGFFTNQLTNASIDAGRSSACNINRRSSAIASAFLPNEVQHRSSELTRVFLFRFVLAAENLEYEESKRQLESTVANLEPLLANQPQPEMGWGRPFLSALSFVFVFSSPFLQTANTNARNLNASNPLSIGTNSS